METTARTTREPHKATRSQTPLSNRILTPFPRRRTSHFSASPAHRDISAKYPKHIHKTTSEEALITKFLVFPKPRYHRKSDFKRPQPMQHTFQHAFRRESFASVQTHLGHQQASRFHSGPVNRSFNRPYWQNSSDSSGFSESELFFKNRFVLPGHGKGPTWPCHNSFNAGQRQNKKQSVVKKFSNEFSTNDSINEISLQIKRLSRPRRNESVNRSGSKVLGKVKKQINRVSIEISERKDQEKVRSYDFGPTTEPIFQFVKSELKKRRFNVFNQHKNCKIERNYEVSFKTRQISSREFKRVKIQIKSKFSNNFPSI